MDERLYELFQKTLLENSNLNVQKIVQGQVKVINQQQPIRMNSEATIKDVQKKLEALEKSLMIQDSARKRRTSRYHIKKQSIKIQSPYQLDQIEDAQQYELENLRSENQRLQERLENLEIPQLEDNEIQREQENLIKIKQEYQQKEDELKLQNKKLDKLEIDLNTKHYLILQNSKKLENQQSQLQKQEELLKEKKEGIETLQHQINLNIQQILTLNKNELKIKVQQKLGVQLEAVEQLLSSTFKERQVLLTEYITLRQLKNVIKDQQREYLKKI